MSKKQIVPEYTFQISAKTQEAGNEQSMTSEREPTVNSESESVDMFSFTPAINTNYVYEGNPGPVHERLIRAGQYYKKRLNKRQDEVMKERKDVEEAITGK